MIFSEIKNTLTQKLGLDENLIKPEAYINSDLELDSTETVLIALELKKKFGVEFKFPKNDLTLEDLVSQVEILLTN